MVRVLIVDDQALVRRGFRMILDGVVAGDGGLVVLRAVDDPVQPVRRQLRHGVKGRCASGAIPA